MTNRTTKTLAATALAALGLSSVSPVQLAATGAVLGFGVMATPALASSKPLPGTGVVIAYKKQPGYIQFSSTHKKQPGYGVFQIVVVPSDSDGMVLLMGLEPGAYDVSLIGEERATPVQVGRDGVLTIRAVAEDNGSNRRIEAIGPGTSTARVMAGGGQTEEAGGLRGGGAFFVAILAARQNPDSVVDVNRSSAADIVRLAPTTSAEAAEFIVAERARGGPFIDPIDFAQRTCPRVSVDFDLAPTRIGNALIIARGNFHPKYAGFQCAPAKRGEDPMLELYGKKHSYVGHVTLLR